MKKLRKTYLNKKKGINFTKLATFKIFFICAVLAFECRITKFNG